MLRSDLLHVLLHHMPYLSSHASRRVPRDSPPPRRPASGGLLLALATLVFVTGCGKTSFVGRRFDNFTAYYNTFYNAQHAFETGVKALEKQDQPIDRDRYLPLFTSPSSSAAGKEFENAIKKSADVLRSHPTSRWVDDALLLIGKSYYYQRNYVGAIQKFNEVIQLASPLEDEARFWLARTLIASSDYDQATEHLTLSLNREGLSSRWEAMLRLALGELHVKRQAWEDAAVELAAGVENVRDSDLGARAQFLLGQVLETMGRYDEATRAYQGVQRFKPLYELSYAAQLSTIRVLGMHGDADHALRLLRRMERDDKNYSNRYELAYYRGRILQRLGRADDALALYDEILYDAEGGGAANLRGRVHYAVAELFRDVYRDFPLAAAYFDTARTTLRASGRQTGAAAATIGASEELYTPAAITDAEEQAERFRNYATVYAEVARMDSLLYLGSLDDEAFAEKILEIRKQRARELAEQQRLAEQQQAMQRFQGGAVGATQDARGSSASEQAGTAAGFLFHKDPLRVQEGRLNFEQRWGDRPLVPNWRRIDAVRAVAQSPEAQAAAEQGGRFARDGSRRREEDALPQIDLSAIPRDSVRQAKMRAERANARYALANVLFLGMSRPDTAAAWYRLVIDEDGDQEVAQRAFYALAEVQRATGDTLAARRLYQQVLQAYPNSDFAGQVRERLGLAPEPKVATDSLALAEQAYDHAYARWRRGFYSDALNKMVALAAQYPETEVAPRALLAAGAIYAEWAERDSLDLFGPLPLSVPDSLLDGSLLFVAQAYTDSTQAIDSTQVAEPLAPEIPEAGTDSIGVADLLTPSDSLLAIDRPDSLLAVDRPDSLLAAEDLGAGLPDSLVTSVPDTLYEVVYDQYASSGDGLYLQNLYASIRARFPQTPYAMRAEALLQELEARRPKPAVDTTLVVPDSSVVSDSLGAQVALAGADSLGGESGMALGLDSLATVQEPSIVGAEADSVLTRQSPVRRRPAALRDGEQLMVEPEEGADAASERAAGEAVVRPGIVPDDEKPVGTRSFVPEGGEVVSDSAGVTPPAPRPTGADLPSEADGALPPEAVSSPRPRDPALFGSGVIPSDAIGWTIQVLSTDASDPVGILMQDLIRSGLRTGTSTETRADGSLRYRVFVGLFETREEAERALLENSDLLPEESVVVELASRR